MSPLARRSPGFCAINVSSILLVVMLSGVFRITSLVFLSLCVRVSSLSPHLSFMSFPNVSNSSLVFVSIKTFPFLGVLSALIPTSIAVGLILSPRSGCPWT